MAGRRSFLKSRSPARQRGRCSRRFSKARLQQMIRTQTAPADFALHRIASRQSCPETPPNLSALSIDGLGKGRRGANIVDPKSSTSGFKALSFTSGETLRVEYRSNAADINTRPEWTVEFTSNKIVLTSDWSPGADPFRCSSASTCRRFTVLCLAFSGGITCWQFPRSCTFRARARYASPPMFPIWIDLSIHAAPAQCDAYVSGATFEHKRVIYTLDVTAIYPDVPGIDGDPRFDAFRRNWLNILQVNPAYAGLANNTASTSCAFCYYEFGDIAALTPPLAEGLRLSISCA